MSDGTRGMGTTSGTGLGTHACVGALGAVLRVRLPGRAPREGGPEVVPRPSFLDGVRKVPHKWLALVALLAVGLLALVATLPAVAGTTFTVTNTDDAGAGSLRQAILDANNAPNGLVGTDVIRFAIPGGGVKTISPASALPTITDPVTINGTTQPGSFSGGMPVVELNGSGAGADANGLEITAGDSEVRGLIVDRFGGAGIRLETNGGNKLGYNVIGTNRESARDVGNGDSGVLIVESSNNTVGGPSFGNDISGNGHAGVTIVSLFGDASGNTVSGNRIGTDFNGEQALPNGEAGVEIAGASGNTIGGTSAAARNVISANGENGVTISSGSSGNAVLSNFHPRKR